MAGRPRYRPTREQRKTVQILAAADMDQEEIAIVIGIDAKTLRANFSDELRNGLVRVRASLLRSLFEAAKRGHVGAQKALLAATSPTPPKAVRRPLLGKKAQAQKDAETASAGTVWDDLINPDRRRAN